MGVLAIAVAVAALLTWRAAVLDTDGDGLTDRVEVAGWQTVDGTMHRTDPERTDTDGDGLTDLDEAGSVVTEGAQQGSYAGYSDPLRADTDDDGLGDGAESDNGLNPRDKDGDHDGLTDGYEVDALGTDAQTRDTDGDGFDDRYEDTHRADGLDPLSYDEQVSPLAYAADFARGLLAGDLAPGDSLAWLAGDLASGASSSVLGPGSVIGGAADLRDAIGSAVHGDWVGAGFSALGAVPGGDPVAIPRKAALFLASHPQLLVKAATMIARSPLSDAIKRGVAALVWDDWGRLLAAGAKEKGLLLLQKGRTDLRELGAALRRHAGIAGPPARAVGTGRKGEQALEKRFRAVAAGVDHQVRFWTGDCAGSRIVDVLEGDVAHQSQVGRVPFSAAIQRQIRKDGCLLTRHLVKKVVWHFVSSSATDTLGADPRVLDLLDRLGIEYEIQLPDDDPSTVPGS